MSVLLLGIPKLIQKASKDAKAEKERGTEQAKNNGSGQKKLFTPGPLSVSMATKTAMLTDMGSRDKTFTDMVQCVRDKIVQLSGANNRDYTCVPMQGSGTFAVESVLSTVVPRENSKVLVLENGAYGKRIAKICEILRIPFDLVSFPEIKPVKPDVVRDLLLRETRYQTVAMVHCETSSGILNPVQAVGTAIKEVAPDCVFIVDAMSSLGGVPLDMVAAGVDFLVSSANKCLQGTPGLGLVIAHKQKLLDCQGQARSLSLDLLGQYEGLLTSGQFRFTPPTHVILALNQALNELEAEGGVSGRAARYKCNREVLRKGMRQLGFREYLDDSCSSDIITTFHCPKQPNWDFQTFYTLLSDKGQLIYPGKMMESDSFRIGTIGHLFPEDFEVLMIHMEHTLKEMVIKTPMVEGK